MIDTSYIEELLFNDFFILPVNKNKTPAVPSWKELATKQADISLFHNAHGIGLICGNGVECIDFDAHGKDIKTIFDNFMQDEGVADIIQRNGVFIESTPSGGFHLIYKYDASGDLIDGNRKLANWEDGSSMIETRGQGGYVVICPTANYRAIRGDLLTVRCMEFDEREYLLKTADIYNQGKKPEQPKQNDSKAFHFTDPVSWYNFNKSAHAKSLLIDNGWTKVSFDSKKKTEQWRRPGKESGTSATWFDERGALYVFSSSVEDLRQECYYTPFQILIIYMFKNSYRSAINWIMEKYFDQAIPYLRIGSDYFKKVHNNDRYGIRRESLKVWRKDEIKQDHGAKYLLKLPKYDGFTIAPDNINYQPVVNENYNLYKPFAHKPEPGTIEWSNILMQHIFGAQIDLGYRYMQALYLHPDRMLPILVLVSKERQTGKTTFFNWLNMIFGQNMANISPEDLSNSFNHLYSTSNIIAVEETLIEKSVTVEKLKALATSKQITVNQKFVSQYSTPFYGKIILASNNEDKFARIDQEEIRFFIRKLSKPQISNHFIEQDLKNEIPAFLQHLHELPRIDWSVDRSGFTPEEIENESLSKVKKESMNWLYKELTELFTDYFNDVHTSNRLFARPTDIKNYWFKNNNRAEISYIRRVLKNDFKFETVEHTTYSADQCLGEHNINGTPFFIPREFFTEQIEETSTELPF